MLVFQILLKKTDLIKTFTSYGYTSRPTAGQADPVVLLLHFVWYVQQISRRHSDIIRSRPIYPDTPESIAFFYIRTGRKGS